MARAVSHWGLSPGPLEYQGCSACGNLGHKNWECPHHPRNRQGQQPLRQPQGQCQQRLQGAMADRFDEHTPPLH